MRAVAISSLGIILLILLLDGSDQANFMSARGIPPLYGFYNSLYRLPDFILKTLPLIILISGMITFIKLSKSLEIIAAKTSGVTFTNILMPSNSNVNIGLITTTLLNPCFIVRFFFTSIFISLGVTKPTEIQLNTKGIFLREALNWFYNH